jgi:hypothetical protein
MAILLRNFTLITDDHLHGQQCYASVEKYVGFW